MARQVAYRCGQRRKRFAKSSCQAGDAFRRKSDVNDVAVAADNLAQHSDEVVVVSGFNLWLINKLQHGLGKWG